jgi:transposase-like protein
MSSRRLTPEERERIVEMRLAGVSVRQVAAEVGTSTKTVVATTKAHLRERAAAFSEKTDATVARLVSRHLAAADAAALAAEQALAADDASSAARMWAEERARLVEVGKLLGHYTEKVEQTGTGFTVLRIVEDD